MKRTQEQDDFLSAIIRASTFSVGWLSERDNGEDVYTKYGMPGPYEGQEKVIKYLRYGGFVFCWGMTPKGTVDALRCDGEFVWTCDLAEEVSKYNLKLEPEFEEAVLSDPKRISRLRRLLIEHRIHPSMI